MDLAAAVRRAITDLRSDASLLQQVPEVDPARRGGEENWATLRSFLVEIPLDSIRVDLFHLITEVEERERALDPTRWQQLNAEAADQLRELGQLQADLDRIQQDRTDRDRSIEWENSDNSSALAEDLTRLDQEQTDLEARIASTRTRWEATLLERDGSTDPTSFDDDPAARAALAAAVERFELGLVNLLRTRAVAWWRRAAGSGEVPVAGAGTDVGGSTSTNQGSTPDGASVDGLAGDAGEPTAPGPSAPMAPKRARPLARGASKDYVAADEVLGPYADRLGFNRYVDMFGALITDRSTQLPLSIGLFAPWGSGKSTFMALLRENIEARTMQTSDSCYRHVRQISFNAWHYSDSNLWASLADHIFSTLADLPRTNDDETQARLAQAKTLRDEVADQLRQASHVTASARNEAERAANDTAEELSRLASTASGARAMRRYFAALGLSDDVDQGRAIAEAMRGNLEALDASSAQLKVLVQRPWFLGLLAAFALAAGVAAVWVSASAIGGTVVAAVLATVAGWTRTVGTGAAAVRSFTAELSQAATEADEERLAPLRRAEAAEAELQAKLLNAEAEVDRLQSELVLLQPRERLYRFLSERAGSDTYAGQLGLISTMRHDLEALGELLRASMGSDESTTERPGIDRIVLYIDDLDRCTSSQVMEVLQAVHVLLAGELFAVVLGVDQRWLLRSVEQELTGDRPGSGALRPQLPREYLEKILNISFTLPRMNSLQIGNLLRGMVDEIEAPEVEAPAPSAAWPVDLVFPVPSSPAQEQSVNLPRAITEAEIDGLANVGALIRSPRAGRRLINTYRMLRAAAPDPDAFLGQGQDLPQFPAVAMMLAMVATHGSVAQTALLGDPANTEGHSVFDVASWAELIDAVRPVQTEDGASNGVVTVIDDDELRAWTSLYLDLEATRDAGERGPMSAYRDWAMIATRFCIADADR